MGKDTTKLEQGDIILNHGMRILLDGPVEVYNQGTPNETWRWPGLVLNADELCDENSPQYKPFIASCLRGTIWEDATPRTRQDEWSVQGNHLATWSVGEPWREYGALFEGDGEPGGDLQVGDAFSRRFTHTKLPGRLFTLYAYPILGDGTDDEIPEGVIRLGVQTELMVCRDIDEPGGTEVWADYTYTASRDLPEAYDWDYTSVEAAEQAALRYVKGFDPEHIDWDGKPEMEI